MGRVKGIAWGILATAMVFLIAIIVFIVAIVNAIETDGDFVSFGFFGASIFAGVLMVLCIISWLTLGILLIVFAVKDHESGIYKGTGIVSIVTAVLCVVPVLWIGLWIAILVMSIICVSKRY